MATSSLRDWQSTKKTVLERNCHMFNNPLMSNITFTCEYSAKSFYAHKYVLGTSSAVFHAMFYGPLAYTDSFVHLSDTNEESLEQFLRFLYTDECDLTGDNVASVRYLSEKYVVPSLTEKCVEIMENCLTCENVLIILEHAMCFDDSELQKKCWRLVDSRMAEVAATKAFSNISQPMLACVLKRNNLNIPEIQLFQAVLKWCNEQCLKNQLEVSGENKRTVLKDAVYDIAYLSISQEDFAKHVQPSELLSADEMVSIYGSLNGLEPSCVKWKKRKQKGFKRIARFVSSNVTDSSPISMWRYESGKPDCLKFLVNRKSLFHGVRLFGDRQGSQYKVILQLDGSKLADGSFTSKSDKDNIPGYDVLLSSPVTIEKGNTVTISATISGPVSCYGGNGLEKVENGELTVSFSSLTEPTETNGTDSRHGQFYQIFISDA